MTVFRSTSADFRSPPAGSTHKHMSGGGKQISADVKRKMVTLIYLDPYNSSSFLYNWLFTEKGSTFHVNDSLWSLRRNVLDTFKSAL